MPLLESDAIILKTYPLGEADRIVAFFSREHGKVRGVANGARKMKNRFGASLEPLTHSRIQFFEKENRDLVRIQSAEILDSPMALFADYDRAVFAGQSGRSDRPLSSGTSAARCGLPARPDDGAGRRRTPVRSISRPAISKFGCCALPESFQTCFSVRSARGRSMRRKNVIWREGFRP